MGFQRLATVQRRLAGTTKRAFAVGPGVLGALEPDVARIAGKALGNRMRTVGVLGAIHAAPCQQAGQTRDADAKHLLGQDVVHSRLQVWHLLRQPEGEAAGDFAKKDP